MKILVLGATGATGKEVVKLLINKHIPSRIVVRDGSVCPTEFLESDIVEIIYGNIHEFKGIEMEKLLNNCTGVVSCLGHNISFKGMFGNPRKLVFETIKNVSDAINDGKRKIKLILMSTTAYTNKGNNEKNTIAEKMLLSLLTMLLPPHQDNMKAGNYLVCNLSSKNEYIEWVAVRPDSLINESKVTSYESCESPVRSPIFDSGKTSRINVAHFMVELLCNEAVWQRWKLKTPVLYNKQ